MISVSLKYSVFQLSLTSAVTDSHQEPYGPWNHVQEGQVPRIQEQEGVRR